MKQEVEIPAAPAPQSQSAQLQRMTGGQAVVRYLIHEGVTHILGIFGHGNVQLGEAIAEFDKVINLFSKGDKVPAARLKKGMALMDQGQTEAARAEFQAIIKWHPRSNEAQLARQQLGEK